MKAFTYQRADSTAQAASAAVKPGAKIIAGGTNLLVGRDISRLQAETRRILALEKKCPTAIPRGMDMRRTVLRM